MVSGNKDEEQQQQEQEEPESRRQKGRRERKEAGQRSAKAARALMRLSDVELERLDLDPPLLQAVERARAIPSRAARRREERYLAKVLRDTDLADLEQRLVSDTPT